MNINQLSVVCSLIAGTGNEGNPGYNLLERKWINCGRWSGGILLAPGPPVLLSLDVGLRVGGDMYSKKCCGGGFGWRGLRCVPRQRPASIHRVQSHPSRTTSVHSPSVQPCATRRQSHHQHRRNILSACRTFYYFFTITLFIL